jgi:hypothetical protein
VSKGRFAAVTAAFRDLARACVSLETAFADLDADDNTPRTRVAKPPAEEAAPVRQRPLKIVPALDGPVTPSAARVLAALRDAAHPLNRQSIAIRSGVAYKSSALDKALAELRSERFVETEGGANQITEAGSALPMPELPQGAALFEYWLDKVGDSAAPGKVLRAMRTAHRNGQHVLSRMDISLATGIEYKSSTLDKALAKLRSLELLQGGGSENRLVAELARAAEVTIGVHDRQSGKSVKVDRKGTVVR